MGKIVNSFLISASFLILAGCSTISFTNKEQPFDGTVHAAGSLICSGYLSGYGPDGQSKGRNVAERIIPTASLIVYGTVDLVSSIVFDALVYIPQRLSIIESGRPSVKDNIPHSLLPCGTLDSSINVVLYAT